MKQGDNENVHIPLLNKLIDKDIKSMRNDVDYSVVEHICKRFFREVKTNNDCNKANQLVIPINRVIQTTSQLFKSVDILFYDQIQPIIDGKSDKWTLKIYKESEVEQFEEKTEDGFAEYASYPCTEWNGKKGFVHIPIDKSGIYTIYSLVHELTHTFSNPENTNSNNILTEIMPTCFERLLDTFLLENINGIPELKKEVLERQENTSKNAYEDAMRTVLKLRFARIKQDEGIVTQEKFNEIRQEFGLTADEIFIALQLPTRRC